MTLSKTDHQKLISLLGKSAKTLEALSVESKHRDSARRCRKMRDKLSKLK